ncbi:MAG: hypothetical protein IIB53_09285, partial [Planctomycetes bacterium]|nr:hypothetical protein [Planctomycetota bacterium]
MSPTLQGRVRLSRLPGICMAFAVGSVAYAGGIACDDPNNCQLPDQSGHGPDGIVAATSDVAAGFAVADNFAIDAGGTITDLCWWGTYTDFVIPCPDGDVADNFTITFLINDPGCPTGAPGTILAGPFSPAVTKMATGNVIPSGLGDLVEYEYTATIPGGVDVGAGECVWVEIQNDTTGGVCLWLWETAEGDGGGFQNGAPTNFDLAFCLNLPLGDTTACALEINPACEGAKGPCGAPNDSPGCEDGCCCTLVCNADPICCIDPWDQQCATAALTLGCATLPPCQPEANCQVFDTVNALNSTGEGAFFAADDFTPAANGDISDICWYGAYLPEPPDPSLDDFTLRYYDDVDGLPGNVIAEFSQSGGSLIGLVREDSGAQVAGLPLFIFSATHAPVAVESGVCYWIELSNPNDGNFGWFWELAPVGANNRRMVQDATPEDPYAQVDLVGSGLDLAFCLGLPLDVPCGIEVVFDTGPHRTVPFNGAPTHLGWSSGNLDNNIDMQRRTVQAFTLPPLPPGPSQWNINQVEVEGFEPDGVLNELISFEIFTRTALDVAPGPDDSLATGTQAFTTVDDVDAPTDSTVIFLHGVSLPPGDYWVTMWASNAAGGISNFAWFTHAEFGINNFCTEDAPPPAPGFEGCFPSDPNGDPPGTPMMLRARLYPDPGFGSYTLDPSVLDIDPGTGGDREDLYNAAFRIRAAAVGGGGEPCPADLVVDGVVGVKDLLFLLGTWGPCPKKGDCPADLVVDGV